MILHRREVRSIIARRIVVGTVIFMIIYYKMHVPPALPFCTMSLSVREVGWVWVMIFKIRYKEC